MKLTFSIAITISTFIACNSPATKESTSSADSTAAANAAAPVITYPYKAEYSSSFTMGDAKNAKLVLDFYKAWEDGRVDDMRAMLTDTINVDFSDGNKFLGTADSFLKMAKKERDDMTSINYKILAWMPVHSTDKNEDWVMIWSESNWTMKNGSADSSQSHGMYTIKNGKIAYWGDFDQKYPSSK